MEYGYYVHLYMKNDKEWMKNIYEKWKNIKRYEMVNIIKALFYLAEDKLQNPNGIRNFYSELTTYIDSPYESEFTSLEMINEHGTKKYDYAMLLSSEGETLPNFLGCVCDNYHDDGLCDDNHYHYHHYIEKYTVLSVNDEGFIVPTFLTVDYTDDSDSYKKDIIITPTAVENEISLFDWIKKYDVRLLDLLEIYDYDALIKSINHN